MLNGLVCIYGILIGKSLFRQGQSLQNGHNDLELTGAILLDLLIVDIAKQTLAVCQDKDFQIGFSVSLCDGSSQGSRFQQ